MARQAVSNQTTKRTNRTACFSNDGDLRGGDLARLAVMSAASPGSGVVAMPFCPSSAVLAIVSLPLCGGKRN